MIHMGSEHPADRRVRIVAAATRVFGEHGWFAARLEEIAQRTGVTKALLLRHWASKDDLFIEVLVRLTERLRGRLEEATRDATTPVDRIERTARCLGYFLMDHPGAWQIMGPIRSDRAPAARVVEQDSLHRTVREFGFRSPQWDSAVALTAEIGAIGLVAGAAHAANAEDEVDPEVAVTFSTWMVAGAAAVLQHLGAVPEGAS